MFDFFALRALFRLIAQLLFVGSGLCAGVVLWSLLQGESDRLRKLSDYISFNRSDSH